MQRSRVGCTVAGVSKVWMQVNMRPNAVSTPNCVLCPRLAVSCGDTGRGLFTLTVSSPRMDCRNFTFWASLVGHSVDFKVQSVSRIIWNTDMRIRMVYRHRFRLIFGRYLVGISAKKQDILLDNLHGFLLSHHTNTGLVFRNTLNDRH
jgi:hypothetical protein